MKTNRPIMFIFPRMFTVREGKVVLQSALPFGDKEVPVISRTHASSGPLRARMQVWGELVHAGEHDPIGHDRLRVYLSLFLSSMWIRRPAEELLRATCESARELHLWLDSTQQALIAARHLMKLSRFTDDTIRFVFTPLFCTVVVLTNSLNDALEERRRLWEKRPMNPWEISTRRRFTLGH